jgi:hypothetical protein
LIGTRGEEGIEVLVGKEEEGGATCGRKYLEADKAVIIDGRSGLDLT